MYYHVLIVSASDYCSLYSPVVMFVCTTDSMFCPYLDGACEACEQSDWSQYRAMASSQSISSSFG